MDNVIRPKKQIVNNFHEKTRTNDVLVFFCVVLTCHLHSFLLKISILYNESIRVH